jgi:hypothetical protein
MIAKRVSGNRCATLPIASPCAKPTPTIRSYPWRASELMFGM